MTERDPIREWHAQKERAELVLSVCAKVHNGEIEPAVAALTLLTAGVPENLIPPAIGACYPGAASTESAPKTPRDLERLTSEPAAEPVLPPGCTWSGPNAQGMHLVLDLSGCAIAGARTRTAAAEGAWSGDGFGAFMSREDYEQHRADFAALRRSEAMERELRTQAWAERDAAVARAESAERRADAMERELAAARNVNVPAALELRVRESTPAHDAAHRAQRALQALQALINAAHDALDTAGIERVRNHQGLHLAARIEALAAKATEAQAELARRDRQAGDRGRGIIADARKALARAGVRDPISLDRGIDELAATMGRKLEAEHDATHAAGLRAERAEDEVVRLRSEVADVRKDRDNACHRVDVLEDELREAHEDRRSLAHVVDRQRAEARTNRNDPDHD